MPPPHQPSKSVMNAHVSAILLGVRDMDHSKRFYTEGLGWEIKDDWKISVFFVPHGGSMVGFYGRDGLAEMVGTSGEGSGFPGLVLQYIVRSEERVDQVIDEAKAAGATILKAAGKLPWRVRRNLRRPGRLRLERRLQRAGPRSRSAVRGVASLSHASWHAMFQRAIWRLG